MHFTTVREIARTSARSVCSITFARRETAVSIVRDERGAEYIRVAERIATEGVNDRPEIHETDLCYPLPNGASGVTEENYAQFTADAEHAVVLRDTWRIGK